MRSILLLPLVARCLETIDVCIWCMFVFMSVVIFLSLGVLYVCVRDVMHDVFYVCIVRRGAVVARV